MPMFNTKLRKLALSTAVGAAMSLPALADADLQPLGSLSAENGVTVISETGKLPIENTYSYFGGDTIVTGDKGLAGLTLGNDGGVYVSEKSSATVSRVNGEYVVELEKGSVGFSFEAGVPFKVMASGKVIQSATGQKAVSGVVALNAKGEAVVRSMNGDLLAAGETGRYSTVRSGETYAMSEVEGQLVEVDVTEVEEVAEAAPDVGPLVVGGVGVVGFVAISNGDDDDDDGDGSPSR